MLFRKMSYQEITLKPVGDVELWYVEPADRAWRLPLHVEWKQERDTGVRYGLVLPAVCFYPNQLLAMKALLGPFAFEEQPDRWLLSYDQVHTLMRKAPGIHGEYYYNWPGGTYPPIPFPYRAISLPPFNGKTRNLPKQPPQFEHYRSFAEFISKEHGIPADVVVVVLTAIGASTDRWLKQHRHTTRLFNVLWSSFSPLLWTSDPIDSNGD